MNPSGLDLDQAPPISVPLRFFVTAPVFALLAALVALWQGPALFETRWSPATLAVTHLVTLGVATMAMIGALLQVLPVFAGAPIAHPRRVAWVVHAGLTAGTLALAGGFLFGRPDLLAAAVVLLAIAFAVLLIAAALSLARVAVASAPVVMLRITLGALLVTIVLGLWLAASRAWGLALPWTGLRDLHPGWALLGWVGLLVVTVANRVVPMFQLTPSYPAWMSRAFAIAAAAALVLWSLGVLTDVHALALAGVLGLCALYATFAIVTLRLQQRRRRKQRDVTLLFWRIAMACAVAGALVWVAASTLVEASATLALLVGTLAIAGAALSAINGMLYRILPFLAWLHLQAQAGMRRRVPHLKEYLDDRRQARQLALHGASLLLLIGAALWPPVFAHAAALAFGASAALLLANIVAIVRRYTREVKAIETSPADLGMAVPRPVR